VAVVEVIRDARPDEAPALEALYERLGFEITGQASTRFGDAPRMSLELSP
jgi:hypothetical protein